MRRNNTLSWRWDYLSTCPAHCPRILFSLLIARIQRLAQDDPLYQHNLLFSLLLPLNNLWRGWCQKPEKWLESCCWTYSSKTATERKRKNPWIIKRNYAPSQLKRFYFCNCWQRLFYISLPHLKARALIRAPVLVKGQTFWGNAYESSN